MTRSCTGIWLIPFAVNSRDRAATRLLSDVAVSLDDVPAGDLLDDGLAGDAHENSWITRALDDRSEGMLYVGVLISASGEAKYALSRSVAARCAGASLLLQP